ncbi:hypothetical protein P7C70_g5473, partial [Phenoliferia sp. Uapishka_3]
MATSHNHKQASDTLSFPLRPSAPLPKLIKMTEIKLADMFREITKTVRGPFSCLACPAFAHLFSSKTRTDVYPAVSPSHGLAGAAKNLTGAVIITGSGRGIGRATAYAFALAGAPKIVLTARSSDELDEVEVLIKKDVDNIEVVKVVADVTREEDVHRVFEKAGEVEVLINNAGAFGGVSRSRRLTKDVASNDIHNFTAQDDCPVFSHQGTDLTQGTYLGTRELLRQIEAKPRAFPVTIINTSSLAAALNFPQMSAYNASKSALNRFTELTHYENLDTVRAFAYHPGGVDTRMARDALGERFHQVPRDSTPELAAGFSLWLATKPEADFLSGRYVSCKWVCPFNFCDRAYLFIEAPGEQDVDELVAKKDEIISEALLFTMIRGQEPLR